MLSHIIPTYAKWRAAAAKCDSSKSATLEAHSKATERRCLTYVGKLGPFAAVDQNRWGAVLLTIGKGFCRASADQASLSGCSLRRRRKETPSMKKPESR